MNTIFEIGSLDNIAPATLLVEIGDSFCIETFVSDKEVEALSVYTFNPTDLEESVRQILHKVNLADRNFEQVIIASAFPQALLMPRKFYQQDSLLLNAIYDNRHWQQLHDEVHEWQIVTAYSMPENIYELITKRFPAAVFIHSYSAALKAYNGFSSERQIAAHFISNQFSVLVKKDQQVLLVQTYQYASPMDVVYFLLKICSEFEMTQEETQLIVSGFIEENSVLYRELYNYFLNIHFAHASFVRLPEHQYPAHFFTSIHNLAACVL